VLFQHLDLLRVQFVSLSGFRFRERSRSIGRSIDSYEVMEIAPALGVGDPQVELQPEQRKSFFLHFNFLCCYRCVVVALFVNLICFLMVFLVPFSFNYWCHCGSLLKLCYLYIHNCNITGSQINKYKLVNRGKVQYFIREYLFSLYGFFKYSGS